MVHLVFIIHGKDSSPGELEWVAEQFRAKAREHDVLTYVHVAKALALGTDAGIAALAQLLAEELRSIIAQEPLDGSGEFDSLSLYGQSLGGVLARYVAGLLWDAGAGRIAGLVPRVFMSNVAPHLGVGLGEGGYLGRVPRKLIEMFGPMQSRTVKELLLLDGEDTKPPLLLRMAQWSDTEWPFMQALEAFEGRYVYANVAGDLLVAYQSAAIQPDSAPPKPSQKSGDVKLCVLERPATEIPSGPPSPKRAMAAGLARIAWTEVAMVIPGHLPLNHARMGGPRLVGLNQIFNSVLSKGKGVAEHQANTLMARLAANSATRGTSNKASSSTPPLRCGVSRDQFVSTKEPSVIVFFFSPGEYKIAIKRLNTFLTGWTEMDVTIAPLAPSSVTPPPSTIRGMRSDKSAPRSIIIMKASKLEIVLTHRVTVWRHDVEGSVHLDIEKVGDVATMETSGAGEQDRESGGVVPTEPGVARAPVLGSLFAEFGLGCASCCSCAPLRSTIIPVTGSRPLGSRATSSERNPRASL